MGGKNGGKGKGGKGGCASGEVAIVLPESLWTTVKDAVDSAVVVGANRRICLDQTFTLFLAAAISCALTVSGSKKKGKGKGKGK